VSDLAAKAFVLALAVAGTVLIGVFGLIGGEADEPTPPGGRRRRFVERMKALGQAYTGRDGRR